MPKPDPDLERYLAGDFAEKQDGMPVVICLVVLLLGIIVAGKLF